MTINAMPGEQVNAIDGRSSSDANPHTDPRVARSRENLIAAMDDLLRDQPIEKITASMAAREAGTSRPTLYQHFGDLSGLIEATAVHNLEQLLFTAWEGDAIGSPATPSGSITPSDSAPHRGTISNKKNSPDAIRRLLNHLQDDRDFFLNVLQGPSNYRVMHAITQALARQLWNGFAIEEGLNRDDNPFMAKDLSQIKLADTSDPTLAQKIKFVADGVVGAAVGWLAGTRDETAKQLAKTLQNLAYRTLHPERVPGH
ncbi:TetR/AcrR family transcriptional regulator [Pseudoglutamicibacter cumminsii]|uniref:TetR/AcrR family transcriptional regulator n=1 Tax=Pseudoglutamicibacter cumminsii TaxID=156979 RepID=A0AAP4FGW9_9MICC|nr:TetR/AcrR family transcriptional regulator [Pseudoglutamicibacter cumminsii]MCT1686716.1 TetR/AcrR family transcriptional regulator [Pseudoglutamicibacter cumminsii]MDK6275382.1 TetR/AcrR family transcriptional regulator [Pseudoglutamicibacter cumminsii]